MCSGGGFSLKMVCGYHGCPGEFLVVSFPFALPFWTRSLPSLGPRGPSGFGQMDLPILQTVSIELKVALATGKPFAASQAVQVPFLSSLLVIAWMSNGRPRKRGLKNSAKRKPAPWLENITSVRSGPFKYEGVNSEDPFRPVEVYYFM